VRVLITGASRGIGRALLDHYTAAPGTEAFGTVRGAAAYTDRRLLPLDVTRPEDFPPLAARLDGAPLDLLVCNAGVFPGPDRSLATGIPASDFAAAFAVNVTGVWLTVEALLPALRLAPAPRIAIVSSLMGSSARAPGGSYAYRASKAAVTNLGRNLAADLMSQGVAVGVYHPGWVRTNMGGPGADIGIAEAVAGLTTRFDALGPASTGVFEGWDGTPLAF
jgi:NAD(P)-dependent dehydrogenase (short-subunit alcohol dehydrogenase family)